VGQKDRIIHFSAFIAFFLALSLTIKINIGIIHPRIEKNRRGTMHKNALRKKLAEARLTKNPKLLCEVMRNVRDLVMEPDELGFENEESLNSTVSTVFVECAKKELENPVPDLRRMEWLLGEACEYGLNYEESGNLLEQAKRKHDNMN
jgi:hypothetical protein